MREQRRLAAVVSADVAGYSRLMGQDEDGTLDRLRSLRRELIDPAIATHGGRIVKSMGDGLLLEFPSVLDAVRCVVEVQTAMVATGAGEPTDRRIAFRVGVNLGDIIIDGDDIHGDGVNVAARLQAIAEPGGVAVSSRVYEHVRDRLDVTFADVGEQALKNIARPVRVYQWLPPGAVPGGRQVRFAHRMTPVRWAVVAVLILCLGAGGWWLADPAAFLPPKPGGPGVAPAGDAAKAPASRGVTIAVLPFVNQGGDASQEYFSDGITEDMVAALGRFRSLSVMARNAVAPYKGKNLGPSRIARELGVRYIVEGSVRRAGDRIRVTAQLTDGMSGRLLWSHQYDTELKDVFAVQDAITRGIAGALEVSLTRIEQQRALAKPTESLDAYDLVLRGRERLLTITRAANRQARQFFEQAMQLDSRYAAAYAWNGMAYLGVVELGWTDDPHQAADRALQLGSKAVELDPDNAVGLAVIVVIRTLRAEYDLALATSDRMLALNPSDAEGLFARSAVHLFLGRFDEAIATSEEGFRFDPNPRQNVMFGLGLAYHMARRHTDALRVLQRSLERSPDMSFTYALLAATYARLDRMAEAANALDTFRRLNPYYDLQTFGSRFQDAAHRAYLVEGVVKAGSK